MAITIRCRIPPENWYGKFLNRSLALTIPTFSIIANAFFFASSLLMSWCCSRGSMICLPTRMVGSRAVIGSWKISARSFPRSFCNSFSGSFNKSRPSYSTLPLTTSAFLGKSCMTVLVVTDLPEPDSPTNARTSPGCSFSVTLRIAWTVPSRVLKSTERCLIVSTSSAIYFSPLVLGSNASRNPSPSKLKAIIIKDRTRTGSHNWY